MRLGQLSRKLNISQNALIDIARKEFNTELEDDPNTKIEDAIAVALTEKFTPELEINENDEKNISETIVEETYSEPVEEPVEESEADTPAETKEIAEAKETDSEQEVPEDEQVEESVVDTSIPLEVDPEAELIKAPKIKLEGLKVVGKIELPVIEKQELDELDAAMESSQQDVQQGQEMATADEIKDNVDDEEDSIYKDKKGIYHFTDQQRLNRQKSLERIADEKRKKAIQERKIRHYEEKMKEVKETALPTKKKVKSPKKSTAPKVEPKGFWQKFIHWLND